MDKPILFIFLIIITSQVHGQKKTIDQNLCWYSLSTTIMLNEKWYLQNEIQERQFINPTVQHQFLIRSHIHRILGKSGWESSLGMCYFLQNPNDPDATIKLTVPEIRPHVEFAFKQKLSQFTLDQRYRLEARIFHEVNEEKTALADGFYYSNLRIRYRLQATVPIIKLTENRSFKIKISDEIQVNAGNKITKNVFEQNRFYAGINYDVLPNLNVEMGYMNWFQQRSTGDFYNRNIISFSIFHTLKLR